MSGREETVREAAANQNVAQDQGPCEGGLSEPSQAVEAPGGSPQGGHKPQEVAHTDAQARKANGDAQGDQGDGGMLGTTRGSTPNSSNGGAVQGSGSGPSIQVAEVVNATAQSRGSAQRKPRLVTRGEFASLSASGLVPASSFSAVDASVQLPACWTAPPEYGSGDSIHIIGVPADEDALRAGAFLRDGYGGLEALQTLETLSEVDIADLESILGFDVRGNLLEPRSGSPTHATLTVMSDSLTLRRELASILTAFRHERLAERMVNTFSFLKRLLVRYRQMNDDLQTEPSELVRDTSILRSENEHLRREWNAMSSYWQGEMREVQSLRDQAEQRFKDDFKRQAQDHQHELDRYIDQVHSLRGQLRAAEARSDALQSQLREKTLGPWAFTDFLEQEPNVTVSANWKRLQELFAHFIAGTKPPAAWMTHIHVLATDDPRCVCGDYQEERKKAGGADSAPKPPTPPSLTTPKASSTTGSKTSPKRKPKSNNSKKSGSKRDVTSKDTRPRTAQELFRRLDVRPTDYAPSDRPARSAQDPLQRPKAEARKALPGAQVWKDLRLDVRYLMLAGQKYQRAMELVLGDNVLHQYFPPDALVRMLKCMILDGGLDCTPWARYVPETYYFRAEVQVQNAIEHEEEYDTWPLLAMDDVEDDSSSSESGSDSSYDPQEAPGDESVEDEESVPESKAPVTPSKARTLLEPAAEDKSPLSILRRSPRPKRPNPASTDSVLPSKRARTASSVPDRASASGRRPTALALIPFKELTLEQLEVVEDVDPRTTSSCRYFGIKIYFYGTKSKPQRYPFPNYAPQKGDIDFLAKRWSVDVYLTMLPTEDGAVIDEALPWVQTFRERIKILYFHDVDKLDAAILAGLSGYVIFMGECCQAWWELLHWVTIKVGSDKDSFLFHQKRRSRTDALLRRYAQEVKTLRAIPGFPETMFHEPGLWPLPTRKCNWIWEDPRVVGVEGKPKPLSLQLVELDFREPARVLWSNLSTDAERIAHVPAEIRDTMLIPEPKRSTNWIVPGRADNE